MKKREFSRRAGQLLLALTLIITFIPGTAALAEENLQTEEILSAAELPVVRIESETPEATEDYLEALVSTENCMSIYQMDLVPAEWRIRKTDLGTGEKRTYDLKFERATDFLGMGEARKWVLAANRDDVSLLRNRLMCELSGKIGVQFFPESRYAELIVNGDYRGVYELCEVPEIDSERVAIHPAREEFLLEPMTETDRTSDPMVMTPDYGYRFALNSINYFPQDQKEWLSEFLREAEAALRTGEREAIEMYFDLPSMAAGCILYEFSKPGDAAIKSLRFVIIDHKLYAGPAWNFEHACGNQNMPYGRLSAEDGAASPEGWIEPQLWLRDLMQTDWFREQVREQYLADQSIIINLYEDNELGKNRIDSILKEMPEAIAHDDQRWNSFDGEESGAGSASENREAETAQLRKWLRERNEWILSSMNQGAFPGQTY